MFVDNHSGEGEKRRREGRREGGGRGETREVGCPASLCLPLLPLALYVLVALNAKEEEEEEEASGRPMLALVLWVWLCWARLERCCWGQEGKTKAVVVATTRARRTRRSDRPDAKEGLMHATQRRGQGRRKLRRAAAVDG
jgi:hypothetical protein